jgi:SAM-dependent methyltransferase
MRPIEAMFQMISGKWVTSAIAAAARLGVADHLEGGPKSTKDLVEKLKVNEQALYRLLRALAGIGVFHEEAGRAFSQTPLSDLLRSNANPCLRNIAMMMSDPWHMNCWTELNWSVETGKPAPFKVYGMPGFEYLSKHPDEAVNFNNAMTDLSMGDAPAAVAAYDFSRFGSIVDVGGGMGGLLARILESAPALKGTLFDMPYVIEQARKGPLLARFADRCSFEGGSFFESVPDADAYIMKQIIHDWDDEHASKILKNCRKGIRPGGKLLVMDRVVGPPNQPDPTKFMDLEMLVLPGGQERDEEEWRALFTGNGFRLDRIIPTASPLRILESSPV